jgi:two-component system phosphate regulon response regulator PhoB
VRSVLYRFPDLQQFEQVLQGANIDAELDLGLPAGATVEDGEWVLAIFELGPSRRATSAASRAVLSPEGARLTFEPRDWQRLAEFAQTEARRPGSIPDLEEVYRDPMTPAPGSWVRTASNIPPATASSPGAPHAPHASSAPSALQPPERRSFRPSQHPSQRPSGRRSRVLVVDDDHDIRELVSVMLEAVDLVVTAVSSAEDAIARINADTYDLLVLDWNLPRMSGLELCRHIRREPAHADLPVLFLTANAASQDMVEAFASGADDYLVKPFRAPELGARIFSLLRRVRRP